MPKTTLLVDYEYTDTNYKTDLVKGGTADTQDSRILAMVLPMPLKRKPKPMQVIKIPHPVKWGRG